MAEGADTGAACVLDAERAATSTVPEVFLREASILRQAACRQLRRARVFVPIQLAAIGLMIVTAALVAPIGVLYVYSSFGYDPMAVESSRLRAFTAIMVFQGFSAVAGGYASRMVLGRYRYLFQIAGFLLSRAGALRLAAHATEPYDELERLVPLFASEGVDFRPPASALADVAQLVKGARGIK